MRGCGLSCRKARQNKSRAALISIKDATRFVAQTACMLQAQTPHPAKSDVELLLENARKSFGLAGQASTQTDVARYAAWGDDYLARAEVAAKPDVALPVPSIWTFP